MCNKKMEFLNMLLLLCLTPSVFPLSLRKHRYYLDGGRIDSDFDNGCPSNIGYSYDINDLTFGPSAWHSIDPCFETCKTGQRQSPVNIVTALTQHQQHPIVLLNPENQVVVTEVHNNVNHAPEFEYKGNTKIQILHNLIQGNDFYFSNIHIHRGKNISVGSEHAVDMKFTPMEAHLVFKTNVTDKVHSNPYNKVVLGSVSHGNTTNETVAAAIAVFLEVGGDDFGEAPSDVECDAILSGIDRPYEDEDECECECEDNGEECKPLKNKNEEKECDDNSNCKLDCNEGDHDCKDCEEEEEEDCECCVRKVKKLSRILECAYRSDPARQYQTPPASNRLEVSLRPEDILPTKCYRDFYYYEGSLTTPPCSETVQWFVMRCHVRVSKRVWTALGNVVGHPTGETLSYHGIRRPLQSNKLKVIRNFNFN